MDLVHLTLVHGGQTKMLAPFLELINLIFLLIKMYIWHSGDANRQFLLGRYNGRSIQREVRDLPRQGSVTHISLGTSKWLYENNEISIWNFCASWTTICASQLCGILIIISMGNGSESCFFNFNSSLPWPGWGWPSPKWKHHNFDKIFIIGCSRSCHFDVFRCS